MITLKDMKKVFNAGKPNEFTAVRGVTVGIEDRKLTVLKGPSGSGKTTLLSIIGCMARPTAGRVFLDGRELTSLPERFLTGIRRSTFGFIFQQFNLIKGISAIENAMLPAYPTGRPRAEIRRRASELFELFNLGGKAEARIEWLSGGETQRVAIARALINAPAVLIADEPTAHLDSILSREFMDIMASLKREGMTIVMASHDPIVYESPAVDRIIEMRDGGVVGEVAS
ncbi:MAG TPA: ABC transporter ATP-binding protein [Nitrospirota bacterium]|nr:ABC transporter ATP-binding protein [Nitrospirota bacterium]